MKPSRAGGLAQVWSQHFRQYCHFRTSMTDAEVLVVRAKDEKQVKKLIDWDAACKAAMEASITQVCLAEEAIKNGTVVDTISGVINTTSFLAKDYLDECIQHLESDRVLDQEGLLGSLRTARDRVQMVSIANALNEIAGFGMVDAAARSVHVGIRHLRLQTVKAVLGQSDLGQMERLIAEIPVTADALFGDRLTNVIVEEATRAKNWDKFTKASGHAGLKKITSVASRSELQSSSCPPRRRGGSGFQRLDSNKGKDSSKYRKDRRGGSSPQKPFRGGGGRPFRGGGRGGRGTSTTAKSSGSSRGKGRGSRS